MATVHRPARIFFNDIKKSGAYRAAWKTYADHFVIQDNDTDDLDFYVIHVRNHVRIGGSLSEAFSNVPSHIIDRVRSGKCIVVIDDSLEGFPFYSVDMGLLHVLIENAGIPAHKVAYITQNTAFDVDYKKYCKRFGIEDSVNVLWFHYFLDVFANTGTDRLRLGKKVTHEFKSKDRTFLLLNNRATMHRIMLVSRLAQRGLREDAYITFNGLKSLGDNLAEAFAQEWPTYSSSVDLGTMHDISPADMKCALSLRREDLYEEEAHNLPVILRTDLYERTWFSVVAESEVSDGSQLRFTEKVLKPLMLGHPFILLGNPGTLASLRQYGFKTFSPLIDETYDEITAPDERFVRVVAEIEKVVQWVRNGAMEEIRSMYAIADHNVAVCHDFASSVRLEAEGTFLNPLMAMLDSN